MSDKPTPCIHGRNFCLECHCVKHDKANCQTCTEWHAEAPKPRCPVFGCTIPRGIPHEHPTGVSAVMRDPVAPLSDDERAELERYRNWMKIAEYCAEPVPFVEPLATGRKLRDALLMAGISSTVRSTATDDGVQVVTEATFGQAPRNLDLRNDRLGSTVSDWAEVRRLSVVQIAGRIATGIVIAVGAASVVILMAMSAGWL